jgi:hypothetical protein
MSTRALPSATTLRERWLRLARAAWLIIATPAHVSVWLRPDTVPKGNIQTSR